jgi:hypothetical protein
MQTLQAFFPKARFIHIIRDPRAVVNSWKKVPWTTGSILGDAKIWRKYMLTARECPPNQGTLFTLQYENLVSYPEKCLQDICSFLKVPFDSSMLDYHSQSSKSVNINREPWKGNALKPVDAKSLNRWQADLVVNEIATIESIAKDEMLRLGYELKAPKWYVFSISTQLKAKRAMGQAKEYLENQILR